MKEYYLNNKVFYRKNNFSRNRKTLVFVHGISGSSSAWKKYEQKFERKYNVLSFDLRGHGKSYKPKKYSEYSIKGFTKDLYMLIKHENIKKFVLVCHSFGVFIGLEFLKEHQNLAESAVLLSPAYTPPMSRLSGLIRHLLSYKKIIDILPIKDGPGDHVDYSRHKNTGDWNIPRMIEDIGNTGLKVFLWGTKQSYNFNAKNLLRKIKIPVLLIHGKKDTIFPYKNSIEMKEGIKYSKLVLLDDADHIIVLNNFEELSKEIDKFVGI